MEPEECEDSSSLEAIAENAPKNEERGCPGVVRAFQLATSSKKNRWSMKQSNEPLNRLRNPFRLSPRAGFRTTAWSGAEDMIEVSLACAGVRLAAGCQILKLRHDKVAQPCTSTFTMSSLHDLQHTLKVYTKQKMLTQLFRDRAKTWPVHHSNKGSNTLRLRILSTSASIIMHQD